MKKLTILAAAGVAVALAASTARAQGTNNGLTVWYDVRATSAEILAPVSPYSNGTSVNNGAKNNTVFQVNNGNLGRAGDAAILFISPELPPNPANSNMPAQYTFSKAAGQVNNSQKNLYKYITVGDRAAGVDEVIGALGLDIDIVKGGAAGEGSIFDAVTYAANAALWDGEASSVTDNGGGIDWTIETKAVRVPVAAGPVFDPTGATPGIHQVATIGIDVSDWDKVNAVPANSSADKTWTVHDSVNNLLVTRVYDGAGPTPELPDFGYVTTGAAPGPFTTGTDEEAAGGDGSTVGTTSVQADATIIVLVKGDYNNDNVVNAQDVPGFNAALAASVGGTLRQRELYLGNFNNDLFVNAQDVPAFNGVITASLGNCPCAP